MINNSIIKDYAEDYILNSGWQLTDFDIDAIVENLRHVALVNDMTIGKYDDCDSFPNDDFIEAFEESVRDNRVQGKEKIKMNTIIAIVWARDWVVVSFTDVVNIYTFSLGEVTTLSDAKARIRRVMFK